MIGEALRLIRVFNDLKQKKLAEKFNLSQSYLSEIESGKKEPSLEILRQYSDEFSIPVSSILFFSEELPNAKLGEKIRFKIAKKTLGFLNLIAERASQ